MKKFFSILGLALILLVLAGAGVWIWMADKYVVPIVMFHSIQESEEVKPNVISPESFREQLSFLKENGYKVISMDALVDGIREDKRFDRKTVVLTFDDGEADNYFNAFPILREFEYPVLIYISPDLIGRDGYLTWSQVEQMAQTGIDFGSHTLSHAYLPDLIPEKQQKEIHVSKDVIEARLGRPVQHFSYPVGGFSDSIRQMVMDAGYKSATTTNRGFSRLNEDVYALKRVRFKDDDTPLELRAKLSGYYNFFRSDKEPY